MVQFNIISHTAQQIQNFGTTLNLWKSPYTCLERWAVRWISGVLLLTHDISRRLVSTRGQWVNTLLPDEPFKHLSSFVLITACGLLDTKPLSKPCWLIEYWTISNKFQQNLNQNMMIFIKKNAFEKSAAQWQPFCLGLSALMQGCANEILFGKLLNALMLCFFF